MIKNTLKNKGKSLKLTTLGFTLIELLAVIVILAIIALIATPIILGIIKDSKENATKRSTELYIDAVELAVANKNTKGKFNPNTCVMEGNRGTCTGEFDPVHCKKDNEQTACITADLEVKVDGEVPTKATIMFENGTVADGTTITIGNIPLIKEKGKFKTVNTEEKPKEEPDDDIEEGPEHLAKQNVKAVTTPTTGIVPVVENGNIKSGSEFKIKVNDTIGELTFFILSNDGDYVNLIAEQNITSDGTFTSEPQDSDQWNGTSTSAKNIYGPQNAYNYLSKATSNWTNVPLIESFTYEDEGYTQGTKGYQSIKTELDKSTGNYITTITPNSGDSVIYENMRARLPNFSEIISNEDGCTASTRGSCPLWMANYLYSSSYYSIDQGKINSTDGNYGYWLLRSTSSRKNYTYANVVNSDGIVGMNLISKDTIGIRPVITILKSDLLRVMQ